MKTTAYRCDHCKEPINGAGYSASIDASVSPVGMDIIYGINPEWEKHFCGRQCLMVEINDRVDAMEKAGDAVTSPALPATAIMCTNLPQCEGGPRPYTFRMSARPSEPAEGRAA